MTPFRVGLLGHGTVGAAFARLLEVRASHVEAVTGLRPELSGVLTRSQGDFDDILERSEAIVELIGGVDPARDYVGRALRAGRHVVTANKQLLSQHGEELHAAAQEHGVMLRFEAAVAGVVPVVRVLQETLAVTHIERIHGIVNGTTNYILTEMARTGASYEAAIADRLETGGELCHVAGKHCESGDVLVHDVHLPDPRPGDVLVTPATGAYGHAMANNYNGVPRPPVIFCKGGTAPQPRSRARRSSYVSRRTTTRALPSLQKITGGRGTPL